VNDRVPARITLISKPGCHLCGPVREVIQRVAEDLGIQWVELSILDDPVLNTAYWDLIPVTLVDGIKHDNWRINEARLRQALARATPMDLPKR
jgi:Glutaredoxin-like domain (DUF836)